MEDFINTYIFTPTRPYSMGIILIATLYYFFFGGRTLLQTKYQEVTSWFAKIIPKIKEWWYADERTKLRKRARNWRMFFKMLVGGVFMSASAFLFIIFEEVYLHAKDKFDIPAKTFYNNFYKQIWWIITGILGTLWIITAILATIVLTDFLFYFWVLIIFAMKNLLLVAFSAIKKFMGIIFGDVLSDYPRFIQWQKGFREESEKEFTKFIEGKPQIIQKIFLPVQLWFLGVFFILGL